MNEKDWHRTMYILCKILQDFRNSYLMDLRVKWSREYLISIWNVNRFKSPILPQIGNTHEMYLNGNSDAAVIKHMKVTDLKHLNPF